MLSFEGLSLETMRARSLFRAKRGWGLAGTSRGQAAVSPWLQVQQGPGVAKHHRVPPRSSSTEGTSDTTALTTQEVCTGQWHS